MTLKGCDVSSYQTENTFPGYDFVIMKASEGVGMKDSMLDAHYNGLEKGQKYGFYHYSAAWLGNSPEAEADYFLSLVGQHAGNCIFALDWEGQNLDLSVDWPLAWCQRVYEKTGVKPVFYCSEAYVNTGKYKPIADYNCGLWMAQYSSSPTLSDASGWSNLTIWQSGDNPIDQDTFYGDAAAWDKYCKSDKESEPAKPETPETELTEGAAGSIYKLYNPNSGGHYYTKNFDEAKAVKAAGWTYEGIAWHESEKDGTPVTVLYNHGAADHLYTTNAAEIAACVKAGWENQGTAFLASGSVPVYRLYNPKSKTGQHFFTVSAAEVQSLVRGGWDFEGVGLFAISA